MVCYDRRWPPLLLTLELPLPLLLLPDAAPYLFPLRRRRLVAYTVPRAFMLVVGVFCWLSILAEEASFGPRLNGLGGGTGTASVWPLRHFLTLYTPTHSLTSHHVVTPYAQADTHSTRPLGFTRTRTGGPAPHMPSTRRTAVPLTTSATPPHRLAHTDHSLVLFLRGRAAGRAV